MHDSSISVLCMTPSNQNENELRAWISFVEAVKKLFGNHKPQTTVNS